MTLLVRTPLKESRLLGLNFFVLIYYFFQEVHVWVYIVLKFLYSQELNIGHKISGHA